MVTAAALIAILPDQLGVARAGPPGQPDIVIILTDDQRFDYLGHERGASSPAEAGRDVPERDHVQPAVLSFPVDDLTGRYAGGHGVWSNTGAIGGWSTFHDLGNERRTIATALDDAGYRTGLVGKYLNGYGSAGGAGAARLGPLVRAQRPQLALTTTTRHRCDRRRRWDQELRQFPHRLLH